MKIFFIFVIVSALIFIANNPIDTGIKIDHQIGIDGERAIEPILCNRIIGQCYWKHEDGGWGYWLNGFVIKI